MFFFLENQLRKKNNVYICSVFRKRHDFICSYSQTNCNTERK